MTGEPAVAGRNATVLLLSRVGDEGTDADIDLVAGPDPGETNVLGLLYERTPESFLEDWRAAVGVRPADLMLLDPGGTMRSVSASERAAWPERNLVLGTGGSTDPGILLERVEEVLDRWRTRDRRTVVYLDELAGVLRTASLGAVVEFVDALASLLDTHDAAGFVRFTPATTTVEALPSVWPAFDAVLEHDDDAWVVADVDGWFDAPAGDGPSVDDVFDALSSRRRRYALYCLRRHDAPVTVRDVAEWVAAREAADGEASTDARRRVYTGLRHVDIPKLESLGLVAHDEDADAVVLARTPAVEPYLSLAATDELGRETNAC